MKPKPSALSRRNLAIYLLAGGAITLFGAASAGAWRPFGELAPPQPQEIQALRHRAHLRHPGVFGVRPADLVSTTLAVVVH